MANNNYLIIADYSFEDEYSLDQISQICKVPPRLIEALIEYEVVHPIDAQHKFTIKDLDRIRKAIRLHHDLEINLAGVAVILEMTDELNELRALTQLYERHFK